MIKGQGLDYTSKSSHAKILEQAAEWLALLEEQPLSPEQQQQFEQWKNSSPQHQKIWQRAEKIRQKLHTHAECVPSALAQDVLNQKIDSAPFMGKLLLIFTGSSIIAFTVYMGQKQAWLADYRTSYAEQQTIQLEDGTAITLNSKTAIDVNYTAHDREIILRFGEIYIETGKDTAKRPFKVLDQHGEMLALGTAFNIQQQQQQTLLTVTEHAVQVTTQQSQQQRTIHAGQHVAFNRQNIYPTHPIQLEQLSWRNGLVSVNRMQLQDFAAIIEKNYGINVIIDTALLQASPKQVEISGSYPINNLDRLIVLLENTYPVQIEKSWFGQKLTISQKI